MTVFQKIIAECDKLFNSGNSAGVEKLLLASLTEAESSNDKMLQLFIQSELMGHYRMQGDTEKSLLAVKRGTELLAALPELDNISAGTILINAGTALSAAKRFDEALEFYLQAKQRYDGTLDKNDYLQAGLLNNMASVYLAKKDFSPAEECYIKALDILKSLEKPADCAVTCLNLAQLYAARDKNDPLIAIFLESAMDYLDLPALPRDGYYAHTCKKCASGFAALGRLDLENELESRAKEIYERY